MARSLRSIMDEGEQGKMGNASQFGRAGTRAAMIARVTGQVAAVTNVIVLPDNQKAVTVIAAFSTAGTLTGRLTPVIGVPATTQVSVNSAGNIVFAAADAVTSAEVVYQAVEGDVIEETIQVVASVGTLLSGRGAAVLISASVTAGVVLGAVTPSPRGAAAATGEARINTVGTGIAFNAAQVVTGTALVKYVATPGLGSARPSLGTLLDVTPRDW